MAQILGNVPRCARRAEGGGNANDETLSGRELIGDVDLLVGSALDQLDVWDGVSCFDHDCGCCVELTQPDNLVATVPLKS